MRSTLASQLLRFIANLSLIFSTFLVFVYYAPFLKYRWFFSVVMELWVYVSAISLLGFVIVLLVPRLRNQRFRLGVVTLLLVLSWAPVLSWVGSPVLPGSQPSGIRVMAYNLWIDNQNVDAIEQSIERENPNILFLSEVSPAMMEKLRSRLDFEYSYRTTGSDNALFTNYEVLEAKTDDLGVTTYGRTFSLVAKLKIGNDIVNVLGVHPLIPLYPRLFHIRNQQLDSFAKMSRGFEGKVIVLGDFNATPWSPYFQRFERRGNLENAGCGRWILASWYFNQTLKARFIKIPIDHIETRGFKSLNTWVGQAGGSDHKPIISVLKSS